MSKHPPPKQMADAAYREPCDTELSAHGQQIVTWLCEAYAAGVAAERARVAEWLPCAVSVHHEGIARRLADDLVSAPLCPCGAPVEPGRATCLACRADVEERGRVGS